MLEKLTPFKKETEIIRIISCHSLFVSLNISEYLSFSDVLRGIKEDHWHEKGQSFQKRNHYELIRPKEASVGIEINSLCWHNISGKAAVCWYLVHCQMPAYSYSTLILACANYLLPKNFRKNNNTLFSLWRVFFWKQNSFLLVWLLLIFISLAVSTVALFTCVFTELVYDALAPWKKKKIRASCNLFLFCFIFFKCYCFCL